MVDEFGLDKAARRAAANDLQQQERRLPVNLNWALPGALTPFDWKFFGVQPPESGMPKKSS
jgi:hypothetical protein